MSKKPFAVASFCRTARRERPTARSPLLTSTWPRARRCAPQKLDPSEIPHDLRFCWLFSEGAKPCAILARDQISQRGCRANCLARRNRHPDAHHLGGLRSQTSLAADTLSLRKLLDLYVERQVKSRRADDVTWMMLVMLARFIEWRRILRDRTGDYRSQFHPSA